MRVTHVAPAAFGAAGLFGGGERYPLELARALAREVECELVTFGRHPQVVRERGGLVVRVLRPWLRWRDHPAHPVTPRLSAALAGAEVVHTHHLRSAPSRLAAVTARARGQRLAVTDHGLGGGGWGGLLPRLFDRFLVVSQFSAQTLRAPPDRTGVIYGGADPATYRPDPGTARAGVLFVGRLTPHKGVDRLLRALPERAAVLVLPSVGETGLLVEPGNVDELRERIELLLADGAFAKRLADNARQLVLERYTWDHCARRCLAAYSEMLAR